MRNHRYYRLVACFFVGLHVVVLPETQSSKDLERCYEQLSSIVVELKTMLDKNAEFLRLLQHMVNQLQQELVEEPASD